MCADPDAVWGGEWGRSRDGCIITGGDRQMGRGIFGSGGEYGASHCNQWGLCDALFSKLFVIKIVQTYQIQYERDRVRNESIYQSKQLD